MTEPLACVIGDLDLVRPLGLAGIYSTVVSSAWAPQRFSRFARGWIRWDGTNESSDMLIERLAEFGRTCQTRPVLYYQDDPEMVAISRHREELERMFRFHLPDPELTEALANKSQFTRLAHREGLPVPPSSFLAAGEPLPGPDELTLPVILKPSNRRVQAWRAIGGERKVVIVSEREQLERVHEHAAAAGIDLVAQRHIDGPEERIESYHAYVNGSGQVAGEFTGQKIRTHPTTFGFSTAVRITAARDVAEAGRSCLERIGLRGVAKVDFKRDADGRLWLLEVNPRFNLWHHPGAAAGVNLPALAYADLMGRATPTSAPARAGVTWCALRNDNRARREAGVTTSRWLRWAVGTDTKWTFALDDPGPVVVGLIGRRLGERVVAWRTRFIRPRRNAASRS